MKHPPKSQDIRGRSNPPAAAPRPYLSQQPWPASPSMTGRAQPLPACPSPRCRRAKACLVAHDNLYCRRTHLSPAKIRKLWAESELGRALAAIPAAAGFDDLEGRKDRIIRGREIRHAHHEKMVARWKSGEFDQLYGPYAPKGALLKPPPKAYVERPAKQGPKGAGQGRAGDV